MGLFQQYIKSKKIVKGNIIRKNVIFVFDDNNQINSEENRNNISKNININLPLKGNNNSIDLKGIEKEIKECKELRNMHANLIKKLDDIILHEKKFNINNSKNENSFFDKIKIGKEIIIKIKNNKFFLTGISILFLLSVFSGFYLTK